MKKLLLASLLFASSMSVAYATPPYYAIPIPSVDTDGTSLLTQCEKIDENEVAIAAYLDNGAIVRMRTDNHKIMEVDLTENGLSSGLNAVGQPFDEMENAGDTCNTWEYGGYTYRTYIHSDGTKTRYKIDDQGIVREISTFSSTLM